MIFEKTTLKQENYRERERENYVTVILEPGVKC